MEKLLPELRFPEFEGEWEDKKLGDFCNNISYGMNAAATTYDGKNKYLRITDIDEFSNGLNIDKATSPDGKLEDKFRVKIGDLLFARTGASVGKSYLYRESDGILYFAGFLIRFHVKNANPFFVYAQMQTNNYKKWIKVMSMRSGQPGINAEEYKTFKLKIPTLPEQIKISNFLTEVDKKLTALKQKKSLLEQYKKGVMQQIFSQELRFKDDSGNDFPDWEEKKLKDISIPIKRTTERLIENIMTISGANGFMDQKDRFSQVIAAGSLSKYTHLLKDEFAYNRGNSKSYKYGCIYKLNHDEALIPYVYHSFKLNFGIPEFMEQIFKAKYLDPQLRGLISSSARMDGLLNIGASSFFQVKLIIPCLQEQTKIANFLSSIDEKINHCQGQIEKNDVWKKGLLQQMFV